MLGYPIHGSDPNIGTGPHIQRDLSVKYLNGQVNEWLKMSYTVKILENITD